MSVVLRHCLQNEKDVESKVLLNHVSVSHVEI